MDDQQALQRRLGSPGYAAPEVVNGLPYNEKIDIFGLGVVTYFALTAHLPFAGPDVATVLRRTSRCKVKFAPEDFGHLRHGVIGLLKAMLSKDAPSRPSAWRIFSAVWMLAPVEVRNSKSALDSYAAMQIPEAGSQGGKNAVTFSSGVSLSDETAATLRSGSAPEPRSSSRHPSLSPVVEAVLSAESVRPPVASPEALLETPPEALPETLPKALPQAPSAAGKPPEGKPRKAGVWNYLAGIRPGRHLIYPFKKQQATSDGSGGTIPSSPPGKAALCPTPPPDPRPKRTDAGSGTSPDPRTKRTDAGSGTPPCCGFAAASLETKSLGVPSQMSALE